MWERKEGRRILVCGKGRGEGNDSGKGRRAGDDCGKGRRGGNDYEKGRREEE